MKTLRDIRKSLGITQSRLAADSGAGQTLISGVEIGSRVLTKETARKLAPVLGLGWVELYVSHHIAVLDEELESIRDGATDSDKRGQISLFSEEFEKLSDASSDLYSLSFEKDITRRQKLILYYAHLELMDRGHRTLVERHEELTKHQRSLAEHTGDQSDDLDWRSEVGKAVQGTLEEAS